MSNDSTESLRTGLQLAIKTITTHVFALGNYAYVCSLLHRPARSHIQAVRVLFFLFVPTLPLVELLISAIRSLLQFVRNYEDDDEIHLRFYLSAALGMHANRSQDDDNKDTKDKTIHLLSVGSHCAEKQLSPIDWVWFGKILAALFTLTQAVGTIVMWIRRMRSSEADALAFDHRNGAMGIASTICSCICIISLIIRLRWKVSKAFEVKEGEWSFWMGANETSQFIAEALLSMLLHLVFATIPNSDNRWLYTSVGLVAFMFTGGGNILLQGWQSFFLVIFLIVFRHDIARRLGIKDETREKIFGGNKLKRAKALFTVLLVLWMIIDIIWLFVRDILETVHAERYYWVQDPLSDSLIVI